MGRCCGGRKAILGKGILYKFNDSCIQGRLRFTFISSSPLHVTGGSALALLCSELSVSSPYMFLKYHRKLKHYKGNQSLIIILLCTMFCMLLPVNGWKQNWYSNLLNSSWVMDNAWASSFSINDTAQHCQENVIKLLHCSVRKRSLVIHVHCTMKKVKKKSTTKFKLSASDLSGQLFYCLEFFYK